MRRRAYENVSGVDKGEVRISIMATETNAYALGNVSSKDINTIKHIPSQIQADTLFTFSTKLSYIIPSIKEMILSPRYCVEDIGYLKIKNLKKIAYPMKCFCDINLHRIQEHLHWYGYYGLAFSKAWGMRNCIQPVHYINPESELRRDFTTAFSAALKAKTDNESSVQIKMKNYLLHQLMYFKPYDGKIQNRVTGKLKRKCFTDECEWRFVPDVSKVEFEQILFDNSVYDIGLLTDLSNSMSGIQKISLSFDYSDLKYIIVKTMDDFQELATVIAGLKLDKLKEQQLFSKIIIWDISKGDF